jgi:hypothetical protein
MKQQRNNVSIGVCMPLELKTVLLNHAQNNNRSLSAEIVYRIISELNRDALKTKRSK